ncbi:MAG: response regulator transcription factor, partial [Streptosporangiaceae bacterium]
RLPAASAAGAGGFLSKETLFLDVLAATRNPRPGTVLIEGEVPHDLLRDRADPAAPPAGLRAAGSRAAGPRAAQLRAAEPRAAEPRAAGPPAPEEPGLTAREGEVLTLMGQGLDPAAIAERLVVSVYTARGHVKNVMMKLGAHTQLETVVVATRLGLLAPGRGPDGPISLPGMAVMTG